MRAPKNSETGVKMAGLMCTRPPEGIHLASRTRRAYRRVGLVIGAAPNARVCATSVAVLVGVTAAARVGIAVRLRRHKVSSSGVAAIRSRRHSGGVAVRIAPWSGTAAEARTTASDAGRTRKLAARGPGGPPGPGGPARPPPGKGREWLRERCIRCDCCSAEHRARGKSQPSLPQHRMSLSVSLEMRRRFQFAVGAFARPSLESSSGMSRSRSRSIFGPVSGSGLADGETRRHRAREERQGSGPSRSPGHP